MSTRAELDHRATMKSILGTTFGQDHLLADAKLHNRRNERSKSLRLAQQERRDYEHIRQKKQPQHGRQEWALSFFDPALSGFHQHFILQLLRNYSYQVFEKKQTIILVDCAISM